MAAGVTTTAITTPEGRFTADVAGAAGAPLVLLLYGFSAVAALLARAGPGAQRGWLSRGRGAPSACFGRRFLLDHHRHGPS